MVEIADPEVAGLTSTGRLYVGKADGGERILGRWTTYAPDGHGGNVALRELAGCTPSYGHDHNSQVSHNQPRRLVQGPRSQQACAYYATEPNSVFSGA